MRRALRGAARFRASVIIFSLVAIAILGTSAWQVAESRKSRIRLIDQAGLMGAKTTAALVEAQFNGHKDAVGGVAKRADVVSLVERGEWGRTTIYLEGLRGIDPRITSAAVFDMEGRLWARTPADPSIVGQDFSTRDYFKGAMSSDDVYVSNVFKQKGTPGVIVVGVASAIRNSEGGKIAVLQATIRVSRILGDLEDIEVPNGGSLTIYDRSGQTVDLQMEDVEPNEFVRRALSGKAGVSDAELPELAGRRLVAYAPISDLGWAVVVEQSRSVVLRPVTHLIVRLLVIGFLVLVSAGVAAMLLAKSVRQLGRERKEKEGILSSIAEGVVTTDPHGTIDSVNPAAESLVERPELELFGKPYHEAFPVIDSHGKPVAWHERPMSSAIEARRPGTKGRENLELVSSSGRRIPVSISASPITDEDGALLGAVAVIRDVTRERESDKLKSSFVSTVSHELRTPLTMIQGFSELLKSGELPEAKAQDAIDRINVSSERLARLIDDLLSVSRIEAGGVVVRSEPTDLSEIAYEVIRPFEDQREIRTEIPTALPRVMADRDKLIQVITNLVSNAIKYSPSGAPVLVRAEIKGSNVEVAVTDEGIGLSSQDQEKLFDLFYRVDRPEVRQAGGNGLGLYITRNLVEMQGGKIWVKSDSSGSTFSFTVPLAATETKEVEVAEAAHS